MKLIMVWSLLMGLAMGVGELRGEGAGYTLEQCLELARSRSASAANARRDQTIAGAQVTQARAQAVPRLSAAASYTRLDELQQIDLGGEPTELGTLDNYSVSADARQVLYSGGKVRAALRAAALLSRRADHALEEAEAALARDVRAGFYDVLFAREAIRVREESLAQMTAVLADVEARFRSGTASEFEMLQAKVEVANARPALIAATNEYVLGLESFKRRVGLDDEEVVLVGELSADPVVPDGAVAVRLALETRPLLRMMEAAVSLKEQDVAAARAGYEPTVEAFAIYNGANSYGYVSYGDEWQWHWNAGVSVRWSVWDGGLTRGLVREKALELAKMRTDLEDLRRSIRLEVKRACLGLTRAAETLAASGDTVALARRALEIAQARNRAGLSTHLEVSQANLALRTAELTLSEARRDQLKAEAELVYATGREDLKDIKGDEHR